MKILLVDDEKSLRNLIDRQLTMLGHNVLTAENGVAAWEVFSQEQFDLVISDIKMPQMDGLELLRRVKAAKPDQDMIMITGFGELDSSLEALRRGASNYLIKPFEIKELALTIGRVEKQRAWEKQLKQEEKRMAQARKMADLGLVSGGVAHEINNPNTFVQGNIQTLKRFWPMVAEYCQRAAAAGLEPPGRLEFILRETPKTLDAMLEGTNRIKKIVGAMASFTGPEREVKVNPVDLNDCVLKACALLAEPLGAVKLTRDLKPNLPPARGFKEEIVELVRELLKNSLKAVQGLEAPLIEIATSRHSQHDVLLVVEDNGPGISVDDRDNLFIPFFTTDPKIGRPGLGLSKVYATARRYGGDASFSSEMQQGARFIVRLPAFQERPLI
ncbi:MAG: response regulator [Thermodesulfobacteriota bacterium]|nr:response regulator [Thermodesulfobacteriota bacterium]